MLMQALRYNAGRIRVKDCPFGVPDGTASDFQLVDRHGHAATKDVRIQSIHQTDWQGRVELSSEARTNYVNVNTSITSANYTLTDVTVADSPVLAPDGSGNPMSRVTKTGIASWNSGGIRPANLVVPSNDIMVRVYVSPGSTARILGAAGTGTGTASWDFDSMTTTLGGWSDAGIHTLPDGTLLLWARTHGTSSIPTIIVRGNTTGIYADCYGLSLCAYDDDPLGAFIPTTSAPVTVTDYTHDGQGGITTGQVPADGAALDWTGTARRAA